MASRTITTPNGETITLSSDELSPADLALAEVLLQMAAEQGSSGIKTHPDEIIKRLIAKGYKPDGNLIN